MKQEVKNEVFEWIKEISISLLIVIAILCIAQPVKVSGQSMYPTLENDDRLLVNRLAYTAKNPKRGDIIVFETELVDTKNAQEKSLVKRVVALPGEHIVIKNNEVYIDDKLLEETYLDEVDTSGNIDKIVPKNHVFAMGDNRNNSMDSRDNEIGMISFNEIIGKISMRVYPFNKLGGVN